MESLNDVIRKTIEEKDIFHNHKPSNPDFEAYQIYLTDSIYPLKENLYRLCLDILINEKISYADIKTNKYDSRLEKELKDTFARRGNQKMMSDYSTCLNSEKYTTSSAEYANYHKLVSFLQKSRFPQSNSISKRMAIHYIYYVITGNLIAPLGKIKTIEGCVIFDLLDLFGYNKESDSSAYFSNKDKYDRIKSYFKIDNDTGQYVSVY